ncbi:hypothetical protein CBI55_05320 [Pseudomonas syringae]|uniref:hypothetical protein n=1 Tax=Pseudomonas syringae TaxID=317 RepID=UPI000C1C965A|nr:hypothetical protein [Pseudomonas syringae]PIO94903.1 hypothetical protein CBI55_05320 [Pseudomonas syringae]POP82504.1 hypothetical protein CXB38_08135 [Pseudomonas syringae]
MNITPKNDTLPREGLADFESRLKRSIVSAKGDEQKKPDRTATDNEQWPPIEGTTVSVTDKGDMRYERDGQGVVVAASTNPKLYQFLKQLDDLSQSPTQKSQVEKAIADGTPIADRNIELPAWGDIKNFEWQGQLETAEVVTYLKQDGEKVTVSKALTPELFTAAQQMGLSRVTVENRVNNNGREVADENVYVADHDIIKAGTKDELGNGVIEFESRDGKQYVVSEYQNKELYDRVADKSSSGVQGDVQKIRDEHGLGNLDELDILSKPTGVKSDEKDKDSEDLTVVELATKNLMDKYQKLVDDKKVDKDSDVYKLVMAIQAKAGMESGRTITPYIEEPRGAESWRRFDSEGETLTSADMQDILDGNNIDKALTELFANGNGEKDKIGKEYQAEMDSAIEKVSGGDKEALAKDLHDKLVSREFVDYLSDLDKAGKKSEGQSDVARLLSSLELLDPQLAKDAQNELQKNSVMAEVDKLMADPGGIPDEYKELALKDIFSALKQGIKGMADIPRRTQETIEKFINELLQDKTKLSDFSDQMAKVKSGEMTQAQLEENLAGKYVGAEDKEGFKKAIGKLNQSGVFGTAAGFTSLGGAIYMLTAKNGQLADDPLERLAIAKDFITFLGSGAQFEKTGIFDLMTHTKTADLLGLSKSIPEIWGKEGLWGKKIETAQAANNVPDVADGLENRLASVYELDSIRAGSSIGDVMDQIGLINEVNDAGSLSEDVSRELLDEIVTRSGGTPPADYSKYGNLNELAEDLRLNIDQDAVVQSINSQRASVDLPALDAESLNNMAVEVERAASTPVPDSASGSGYASYSDSLYELYDDAVQRFVAQDITPPTREAFAAGIEDQLERNGQPVPAENDRVNLSEMLGSDEIDRESINVMLEADNQPIPADDIVDNMRNSVGQAVAGNAGGAGLVDPQSVAQGVQSAAPEGADKVVSGVSARIAGSVVKVLGVAPDIMSIADIVMGGIAIKDGIKSGSDLAIANGSLQIVSGVAGTAAAGIGIAGLLGPIGAIAGATAPLFLVTAGLGIITGIISVFVDHQKKQKATDKEGQWFKDQAELGFAQDDWGDKLEYGRYSFYEYEGRDAPDDQSIFDYQTEEWKHFQETPQDQGSSMIRLDESSHKDKNGIVGENTNGLPMDVYNKAYYDAHKEEIETIREKWDEWNGKDDIVSKKDFEKILSGGDEKEKAAAEFILSDQGFFDLLDNLWKKDKRDTKISTDDLDTWLKLIDVMDRTPGETVFYEKPKSTVFPGR